MNFDIETVQMQIGVIKIVGKVGDVHFHFLA